VHSDHNLGRGLYGARRVWHQLKREGHTVPRCQVERLMRQAGLQGARLGSKPMRTTQADAALILRPPDTGRPELPRQPAERAVSRGLHLRRDLDRDVLHRLVTDITERPTREGKVYCCVVLDVRSRKVVGWSIDSTHTASLATNALGMAIESRRPPERAVIHSDHGVHHLAFTARAIRSRLLPSMGAVGSCYDNAVIEAFWGRMQVELLNRKRWNTRIELANAIFEYPKIFHNRRRRHSALGMLTPNEYETINRTIHVA
jgi:putative transposase